MLRTVDTEVESRWRALVERSPQRSALTDLRYVKAAASSAGLRLNVHFAGSSGSDEAAAAVTWRKRGPYSEAIVPPLTPYSAILLAEPPSDAAVHARSSPLERLLSELEESFDAIHLHLPPSISDVRAATWRGWSAKPLYTYRTEDADPSTWSDSTSRNYRGAIDHYEIVRGADLAETAARLAASSYDRHDREPPLRETALAALVRDTRELAEIYGARSISSGEIEAVVAVLRSGGTAYYWVAGSLPGDAMTVLVGALLEDLFDSGITTFDFVGANTPSIAEFKRRFGAHLVPYYRISYCRRLDLKLLYTFRKILR